MKLIINKIIEEGSITVEESINFKEEELPFKLNDDAKLKLTFEHVQNREIRVYGAIEATFILTCVVCLNEFEYPIKIEVDEFYSPREFFDYSKEERPIEELNKFTYTTNYLDTKDIVRDNLLEVLPPYPKCPKCSLETSEN